MPLFLPSDTFSFGRVFFSTLSRRQWQEEADGEGHLNKPSVQPGQTGPVRFMTLHPSFPSQRPFCETSDCTTPYYLLSTSPIPAPIIYFSLSLSFFLIYLKYAFVPSISLLLYLGISFSLTPPLLPDILASCSSRQRVYSCLREAELQLQRLIAQPGGAELLSQHPCLFSLQHPRAQHNLDTTTTCFPHTTHAPHRGSRR